MSKITPIRPGIGTYARESDTLTQRVRETTQKAPFFEQIQIKLYRENIRYRALKAAGRQRDINPKDLSMQIFGRDMDIYEQKSLNEHIRDSSRRAKAVYTAMMSLAVALSAVITVKTESLYAAVISFSTLIISSTLAMDKLVRMGYEHSYVSTFAEQYYGLLKHYHVLCKEVMTISDESPKAGDHFRAQSLLQEMSSLLKKMELDLSIAEVSQDIDVFNRDVSREAAVMDDRFKGMLRVTALGSVKKEVPKEARTEEVDDEEEPISKITKRFGDPEEK